jgi:AbrB family looped-hinge helix DNA binding protein
MDAVTISPKFQVVIPKAVRDRLRLVPGQAVQVFAHGDRIEFVPVRPARELRGMLKGLDVTFERDEEDRM